MSTSKLIFISPESFESNIFFDNFQIFFVKLKSMEKTTQQTVNRGRAIVRTSILGIFANVLLAFFKAFVGIISNSIAITLDSVNNLSDAASSVITIIGAKLAAKPADKKHPFGYGRLEYLSAMVIAIIILYAGITSLVESVKKIISPQTPEYSAVSIIILSVAVVVKIVMGFYVKSVGEKVNSDSLVASGKDALMDSLVSFTTVIAAIFYLFAGVALEPYVGALISFMILKAGVETLVGTISEILGERAGAELARNVKKTISEIDGVLGVYDLVLNNYGPDSFIASVHIELDDSTTVVDVDKLQRKISKAVFEEHGIIISAVGVYPANTGASAASAVKNQILDYLKLYPSVLEMHGLYVDEEEKTLRMDIIIDFDEKDRGEQHKKIQQNIEEMFPQYKTSVQLDLDVTSL